MANGASTSTGADELGTGCLRLLTQLFATEERDRRRLARELHDEIAQSLTSLLLGLRSLEQASIETGVAADAVAPLRELAVTTIEDIRRLSVELRPRALDDYGLATALERMLAAWERSTGIEVAFTANLSQAELPGELATGLYRIAEELMTNIVKHAHARHVSIVLTRKTEAVVMIVEDDGQGFDPPGARIGIAVARARAASLGGRLSIESSAAGASVVVEAPLPRRVMR